MAALAVIWRILDFFVVPNLFICTDAANDNTKIVLFSCGIPYRNLFFMPMCVRNVHHLYQLPDCLVAVDLVIPLVMLRMSLVEISRR